MALTRRSWAFLAGGGGRGLSHLQPLHRVPARPRGCALISPRCHGAERPWRQSRGRRVAHHVCLLAVGEQEQTPGTGSPGNAVPAALPPSRSLSLPGGGPAASVLVAPRRGMSWFSHRFPGWKVVPAQHCPSPRPGRRGLCVAEERVSCPLVYNVSYLQLAHLPQVSGAAFLRSYLQD